MPRLAIYLDLRVPEFVPQTRARIYAEALEMLSWCDTHGWDRVFLNEHHAADDGYLPAPVTMASAIAARTSALELRVLLLAPFYDPIRLAEDLAIVDLVSEGRIAPVLAAGYRPFEFNMFGRTLDERRTRLDEAFDVLRQAWTGDAFSYRGRTVRVRPTPHRPGGPPILMGGSTARAARHAARVADGWDAKGEALWQAYRDERVRLGRGDPGGFVPMAPANLFFMVSSDPERALSRVWRNIAAWSNSYNEWFLEAYGPSGRRFGPPLATLEDVRASGYRFRTPDEAFDFAAGLADEDFLCFRPLCGGMDPEVSWESLELYGEVVQPRLAAMAGRGAVPWISS